jgi:glycosyltransferase involved in cell wall biosynthesis
LQEKLLFITISSLATNPRLVKEFEVLKHDFQCTVICFEHTDWSEELSRQIIERNPEVTFHRINRKENILITSVSKLTHKLAILFNPFFQNNLRISAYASSDKTVQLKQVAQKISKTINPSRIIAHNLGAFYPALKATNKNTMLQLDIEDYHPGEIPYFNQKHETKNRILIMKRLLEKADHVMYASPLIMEECLKLMNNKIDIAKKSTVINNSFSQKEFVFQEVTSKKMKLVWFSQNIAKGRGLERIIPVLNKFSEQVELHLIGNLYTDFKEEVIEKYQDLIVVHLPMPQTALNSFLANYDIGLAIEVESADYNRQICLTNKIWAYLQAGLTILATNTPAQKEFIRTHDKNGIIVELTEQSLKEQLSFLVNNIEAIRKEKAERFEYAKQFSWEVEQEKLKKITLD